MSVYDRIDNISYSNLSNGDISVKIEGKVVGKIFYGCVSKGDTFKSWFYQPKGTKKSDIRFSEGRSELHLLQRVLERGY